MRDHLRALASPRAILIAGWLCFVVYAYPGYLSYDSVWQLLQARGIQPVNEWHPPLMAMIWRVTDTVVAGPFPMLAIQSVAFLLGARALLRRVMSERAAGIVAVVILVVPPNIVVMGVIWKDAQMAGFLISGIAALLSADRRWRLAGCGLLLLATGVRYNAAAATLPIVLGLFEWRVGMSRWRRAVTAVIVWVAITASAFACNALLVDVRTHPWQTSSAPVDIAGIIRYAPDLTPAELLELTPGVPWLHPDEIQAQIRRTYKPTNSFLEVTGGSGAVFEVPTTDAQRDALSAAWATLVLAYPGALLHHRLSLFRVQLGLTKAGVGSVWSKFINEPWGEDAIAHRATHSWLQQAWVHALEKLDRSFVYRPWIYLVLALAFLPMCRRQRTALVILLSGIMYELGVFAAAPATDYRYSHWMVVSTIIAGTLLFATRLRSPPATNSH